MLSNFVVDTLVLGTIASCVGDSTILICTHIPLSTTTSQDLPAKEPFSSPCLTQKENFNMAYQCILCDPTILESCLLFFFTIWTLLQPYCPFTSSLGRPTVFCPLCLCSFNSFCQCSPKWPDGSFLKVICAMEQSSCTLWIFVAFIDLVKG